MLRLTELAHLWPKQLECMDVLKLHPYTLYGGAAGGGKSRFARWFAVICVIHAYALHGVRKAKFGLFCEDYPSLRDRQISAWDVPRWLGEIKKTEAEGLRFRLQEKFGGGMVLLRNLDDPSKYDSVEFIGIAVDEWTRNPWRVFNELRKRLRWPMLATEPHLPCGGRCSGLPVYKDGRLVEAAATVDCPIKLHHQAPAWNFPFLKCSNPGGESHAETKRVYVDTARGNWQNFPPELEPIKHKFAYVQALASDNPGLPTNYKKENLDTLPEKMRRAYAEASWEEFEGQYFDNFHEDKRRVSPVQIGELIKPWWPRWISSDWGHDHWWITQWHATGEVSPEEAALVLKRVDAEGKPLWKKPKKVLITYREIARRRLSERAGAEEILRVTPREERELIQFVFLSPDAFGERKAEYKNSIADEVADCFVNARIEISGSWVKSPLPAPQAADNSRIPGWQFLYSLVDEDRWFISSMCPLVLNSMPALKHPDPNKGEIGDPEDVLKTDDISDDVADCSRYGAKSMMEPNKKPKEVERLEELAKHADPHTQSMVDRMWKKKHKRDGKPIYLR